MHQHHWLDESNLRDYGRTGDGTRVTANRLPENPMRRRMEEAARLVGLQYIANVVMDDRAPAHREHGARVGESQMGTPSACRRREWP